MYTWDGGMEIERLEVGKRRANNRAGYSYKTPGRQASHTCSGEFFPGQYRA
jgi:hypothetical protein